jgi:hypothetical protein
MRLILYRHIISDPYSKYLTMRRRQFLFRMMIPEVHLRPDSK